MYLITHNGTYFRYTLIKIIARTLPSKIKDYWRLTLLLRKPSILTNSTPTSPPFNHSTNPFRFPCNRSIRLHRSRSQASTGSSLFQASKSFLFFFTDNPPARVSIIHIEISPGNIPPDFRPGLCLSILNLHITAPENPGLSRDHGIAVV